MAVTSRKRRVLQTDREDGIRRRRWTRAEYYRAAELGLFRPEERLELLDSLWTSLGRDPTGLPLDEAQRSELEQRLEDLRVEGPTGFSWDEVVAQARAQSR